MSKASEAFDGKDLRIRFKHDQIGMLVEASIDNGAWFTVQLSPHRDHATRAYGWGERSLVMSTARDEQAYLATLDAKGIKYRVVHS